MTKEDKINRLKKAGYEVKLLGRNIQAKKGETVFGGTVSKVHRDVFGY